MASMSLHDYGGVCDYCGGVCDSTLDELNAITCSFEQCPDPVIYHQHCVEAYLKSIRLDKQRKTGFSCPRGAGKATKYDKTCPGRVQKSHPIHARNDNSKKRRKAQLPEALQLATVKKGPAAAKGKEPGTPKDSKDKAKAKPTAAAKPSASKGASSPGAQPGGGGGKVLQRQGSDNGGRPEVLVVKNVNWNAGAGRDSLRAAAGGRSEREARGPITGSDEEEEGHANPRGTASLADFAITIAKSKRPAPPPQPNAWAAARKPTDKGTAEQPPQKAENPAPLLEAGPSHPRAGSHAAPTPQPLPLLQTPPPGGKTLAEIVGKAAAGEEEPEKKAAGKPQHKQPLRPAVRQVDCQLTDPAEDLTAPPKPTAAPPLPAASTNAPPHPPASPAAAASAPLPGVVPPLISSPGAAGGCEHLPEAVQWSERVHAALKDAKVPVYAKQLQELGFQEWQCLAAVRVCGSDLNRCCDWLMSDKKASAAQQDAHIDISAELRRLTAILREEGVSKAALELAVVSCGSNLDAALLQLKGVPPVKASPPGLSTPPDLVVSRPSSNSSSSHSGSLREQPKASAGDSLFSGFDPFGSSTFISDPARYSAVLGMAAEEGEGDALQALALGHSLQAALSEDLFGSPAFAATKDALYAEATQSTVSSVAAAVLDEPVGGCVPSAFSTAAVDTPALAPFAATSMAAPGSGIWGFDSVKDGLALGYTRRQGHQSLFSNGPSLATTNQLPKPEWGGCTGGWAAHAPSSGFENDQEMLVAQLVSQLLV